MEHCEARRVELAVDLTRYKSGWTVGAKGWTVPRAKFSDFGWQDRFVGVRFDNGTTGDILLSGLNFLPKSDE
jgi:hypothetical protein